MIIQHTGYKTVQTASQHPDQEIVQILSACKVPILLQSSEQLLLRGWGQHYGFYQCKFYGLSASQQSPQLQKTVLWTSAPGAQRNVFSSMPRRLKFCGLARQQTCARFHQTTAASAWVHSRLPSERHSRPQCLFRRQAVDARPRRPYSTDMFLSFAQIARKSVASSATTSRRNSSPPLFYHSQTTVMSSSLVFQRQYWHRCDEFYMLPHVSYQTSSM